MIIDEATTFEEGRKMCKSVGGDVLALESEVEFNYVIKLKTDGAIIPLELMKNSYYLQLCHLCYSTNFKIHVIYIYVIYIIQPILKFISSMLF